MQSLHWGMREILEICQKCDMKSDMIDLHYLSTTIIHTILLVVASFSIFPWVRSENQGASTQVALLIVTDNVSALRDDVLVKRCLCTGSIIFRYKPWGKTIE